MAKIEDLVDEIADAVLRERIAHAVKDLKETKRFGLVFEEHIPETVSLYGLAIRPGLTVQLRTTPDDPTEYQVLNVRGGRAVVTPKGTDGPEAIVDTTDLLVVKRFQEQIYPGLAQLGEVRRGDAKPAHVVIRGENFHALQVLTYTHAGKVDCIYIDPPYNTGARDWKYNNRFVDENDSYRHSKWLSFMDKRLRLAETLLKHDGVLICTIDQNELHHLGTLLEERFPKARRQLVTICINPGGASGSEGTLSRVEEYAFFCFLGDAEPAPTDDDMLVADADMDAAHTGARGVRWEWLMRGGNAWYRSSRPNLCYPVVLNNDGTRILRTGPPLEGADDARPDEIDGQPVAWPIRRDGKLGIWRVDADRLRWLADRGYAFVSAHNKERNSWTIKYLMSGTVEAIESGTIDVVGTGERGEVLVRVKERTGKTAKTMWYRGRHIGGGAGGTHLLNAFLGERNLFPFPKSVYAVADALKVAVGDRPNAVILDFFAGSGTTLNAACLMNAADGGERRCILVTNNEVNPDKARQLVSESFYPGDAEFEKHGIFEAVTVPRSTAIIEGKRSDGTPVEGSYLDGTAYSQGFRENAAFFRIDYLDPDLVELGRQFSAIAPMLWMAAGSVGAWEEWDGVAPWSLPEGSTYGVLFDEDHIGAFAQAVEASKSITHVWIVTDSHAAYAEMRSILPPAPVEVRQLYRDYIRNFTINTPGLLRR